jgi:hypothetical protein
MSLEVPQLNVQAKLKDPQTSTNNIYDLVEVLEGFNPIVTHPFFV